MRYSLAPNIIWEMLADGRLFGMLGHTAGFVLVTPVRYVCRATVDEMIAEDRPVRPPPAFDGGLSDIRATFIPWRRSGCPVPATGPAGPW